MSDTVIDYTTNCFTQKAYQASLDLFNLNGVQRSKAVVAIIKAIEQNADEILEANTLDLEASRDMAVSDLILDWLKLTPERINQALEILERLAELSDPLWEMMNNRYQWDNHQTYCQRMPLGVVAFIYEAFPELAAIVTGMCLKTGNSIILRGGAEATHTNQVIADIMISILEKEGLPLNAIQIIIPGQGSSIKDLVTKDQHINLVIPYGRPGLVQKVIESATAPVIKTAMGNCYLYWSQTGSLDMARQVIISSHDSQPDPVNAIEKVLITRNHKSSLLKMLWSSLKEKGFSLRGDAELIADFPELTLAKDSEWRTPYLAPIIAFKYIDNLDQAILWINQYSSGHADCIVTESYQESRLFGLRISSASVYLNSSPKFSRYPQQGNTIFLAMSNQKGFRRGIITLDTLTTVKHVIQGY